MKPVSAPRLSTMNDNQTAYISIKVYSYSA
jgi:hypothetical protein